MLDIFTAELENNSTVNANVWETAGLAGGNAAFPLEKFSYNNSALLDVIFRKVQETDFRGITVSGRREGIEFGVVEGGGGGACRGDPGK